MLHNLNIPDSTFVIVLNLKIEFHRHFCLNMRLHLDNNILLQYRHTLFNNVHRSKYVMFFSKNIKPVNAI